MFEPHEPVYFYIYNSEVLSCPDPNFVFPKLHRTLNIIQLIRER